MSLITDARTKADSAVRTRAESATGTAKATLNLAQNVLSAATDDARERVSGVADGITSRANARVEDVRNLASSLTTAATTAAGMARKQALVTLGAGDLVLETLTKRAEELPGEVQRNAGKGVTSASVLARSARAQATSTATQVRVRGEKVAATARNAELPDVPDVRGAIDSRVGQALYTLDQLAARGEKVVGAVRHNPRLLDAVRDADHATENAANEVSSVAGKVRYRAAANARSVRSLKGAGTRAAHATPAGSAPTKPARKTTLKPASQAAAKVAPAKRVTKSAAGKSAAATSAPVKRAAKKAPAAKATASKAAPTKTTARKTTARKTTARKTTARKTTPSKATARQATPRKTTARKAAAR